MCTNSINSHDKTCMEILEIITIGVLVIIIIIHAVYKMLKPVQNKEVRHFTKLDILEKNVLYE